MIDSKETVYLAMIKCLICIVIMILIFRIAYFFLNHETIFPLGRKAISCAAEYGVFHYTSKANAKQILLSQQIKGSPDIKSTFPNRRENSIVWLLLNSDTLIQRFFRWLIVSRHCPNHPKGHDRSVKYEVKLLITGINLDDLAHMYYNFEFGIGCYTDCLHDVEIIPAPLDDADRTMGIINPEELISYLEQWKREIPL